MSNYKSQLSFTVFYFVFVIAINAQDSIAVRYSQSITSQKIKEYVYTLASPEMEGRETGMPGQKKAAEYIASKFKEAGVLPAFPNYYQPFSLRKIDFDKSRLEINGRKFRFGKDFYSTYGYADTAIRFIETVFAGYGISDSAWNDYAVIDVKGKAVLVLEGAPVNENDSCILRSCSKWKSDPRAKAEAAKTNGAAVMIYVSKNFESTYNGVKKFISRGRLQEPGLKNESMPVIVISQKAAATLMNVSTAGSLAEVKKGINKSPAHQRITFSGFVDFDLSGISSSLTTENVIGMVEGNKKDEAIVISAHYDHLGKRKKDIYFGADDDGSGTATVMNLAETFALAAKEGKRPERTIIFCLFTGEEKGLLGSKYYVKNPLVPLTGTVVNLNIDMIGRIDEHHGNGNYTYIIGSDKLSSELHSISEKTNSTYTQLLLDYKYNDEKDPNRFYYRSDHYSFARNNIPVIFYFTGVHDDYHKPTDTPDKIDYEKTAKIAKLVFHTAWELANMPERIVADKKSD